MKVTEFRSQVNTVWNQAILRFKSRVISYLVVNLLLVLGQFVYISLRIQYLTSEIPFWYTNSWGLGQLAEKSAIYQIPMLSLLITFGGFLLLQSSKYIIRFLDDAMFFIVTGCNLLLSVSIYRIVQVSSTSFKPLINPILFQYIAPALIAFTVIYVLTPLFIKYAERFQIITNPRLHAHPGMVLTHTSARGGGFMYALVVLVLAIFYLGPDPRYVSLYVSLAMLGTLGFLDDYQNTHPLSKLKSLENPILRLILLTLSITPVVVAGFRITVVSNLFGGVLWLSDLVSIAATFVWIVWVLNALSWSNGIDGQYAGIVGVASVITVIFALRFSPLLEVHKDIALLSAISAGAAFGITRYTWFPSRIMWGFGAMSAALILAVSAIAVQSKIAIAFLIILIPFLDSIVTVFRRLLQGKNPLSGDRGHLHHLLLDKGWKPQSIALFYWITSAVFGVIGLLSAEKYLWQIALILSGVVAFVIVLLNLISLRNKSKTQLFD